MRRRRPLECHAAPVLRSGTVSTYGRPLRAGRPLHERPEFLRGFHALEFYRELEKEGDGLLGTQALYKVLDRMNS